MPNTKSKIVLLLLSVVTVIELYGEYYHSAEIIFFTKPAILPLIAAYFLFNIPKTGNIIFKTMMSAFFFSWMGGNFLMLAPETPTDTELMGFPKNKYFFIAGLSSFLIAQTLFIISYKKSVTNATDKIKLWQLIPFIVYWIIMMFVVLPPLSANVEKKAAVIPVIIYSAILLFMAATALQRLGRTTRRSFLIAFIGACFFVISDSLIAINFLAMPLPAEQAGFSIMITYIAAEFFIAQGILNHYNHS